MYSVSIVLLFVAFQAIHGYGAPDGEFKAARLPVDNIRDAHRVVKRAACNPDIQQQLCRTYKSLGLCNSHIIRAFMMQNCPITCGFCQAPPPSTTTASPPTTAQPVDGNWSEWGPWSVCSATCRGGQQRRLRACNNPPPSGGGADCVGNNSETQSCNTFPCPGYGGWSNWGSWGSCTETCGSGLQLRSRSCTNPPPTIPAGACEGELVEVQHCNTSGCVVPPPTTALPPGQTTPAVPTTSAPIPTASTTLGPLTAIPLSPPEAACLKAHNDKRRLHGSPPLIWNATLAQDAMTWADELARVGQVVHAQNIHEGENLYKASGPTPTTCVDAVELWYAEASSYNYGNPGFSPITSHFTQIVWKATTHVGAAAITEVNLQTHELDTYIVARYAPKGNVPGQFDDNVVAPLIDV